MQIEVSEQPGEGSNGEVWVRVMSDTMVDWPSVLASLAPDTRGRLDACTPTRSTPAVPGARGYRYERWFILDAVPQTKPDPYLDPWLCELCDLEVQAEVTVTLDDDGPAQAMCLGCCSAQLKAESRPDYRAPKIVSFYVYPTVIREDTPCGEWVRDGESFKYAGALT